MTFTHRISVVTQCLRARRTHYLCEVFKNIFFFKQTYTYIGQIQTAALLHPIADQESHQVDGRPVSGKRVCQVESAVQLGNTIMRQNDDK